MSVLSSLDINHLAKLANLPLTKKEILSLKKDLSSSLNAIKVLSELATEKTPLTYQVTSLRNVSRQDQASPGLSQKEALANSSSVHNSLIKIARILNE